MNYNFSKKPATGEVTTYIDENIKGTALNRTPEEVDRLKREYYGTPIKEEKKPTQLDNMKEKKIQEKRDNVLRLIEGIQEGKIVTVTSAVKYIGVTRTTILTYIKENEIEILDDERGVWLNKK